jgi:hypothetical protein
MNRIKNFLLCLVLLAVVGILHHEWLQMSGVSGIATPASAATLSNGSNQACNGTGTWHFVNPQNGGDCEPLTVVFSCGGIISQQTATVGKCNTNTTNYNTIQTSGDCSLSTAFNNAPGKVVLSNFSCVSPTPTPTPTPTP